MKTFMIEVDLEKLNDFQKGRISGMIYCLTGMPEKMCAWYRKKDSQLRRIPYHGTVEQHLQVISEIEKNFPGILMRETEIVEGTEIVKEEQLIKKPE